MQRLICLRHQDRGDAEEEAAETTGPDKPSLRIKAQAEGAEDKGAVGDAVDVAVVVAAGVVVAVADVGVLVRERLPSPRVKR